MPAQRKAHEARHKIGPFPFRLNATQKCSLNSIWECPLTTATSLLLGVLCKARQFPLPQLVSFVQMIPWGNSAGAFVQIQNLTCIRLLGEYLRVRLLWEWQTATMTYRPKVLLHTPLLQLVCTQMMLTNSCTGMHWHGLGLQIRCY